MKIIYACVVLTISSISSISSAQAQSPVEMLRNANLDKAIAKSIRTKDKAYAYANEQDGRYTIAKAKSVELWFNNYTKSVEVYKYTVRVGLAEAKRSFARLRADFSQGNMAYISNGDPNSRCYAIQLEPLSATSTRVSFSYECD
jgi:hypothetical protein